MSNKIQQLLNTLKVSCNLLCKLTDFMIMTTFDMPTELTLTNNFMISTCTVVVPYSFLDLERYLLKNFDLSF